MTIICGDDTNAFGQNFLEIDLENPNNKIITKAEFRAGSILKVFINPKFPLNVNLSSSETKKLKCINHGYLTIFDENGLQTTLEDEITFTARKVK